MFGVPVRLVLTALLLAFSLAAHSGAGGEIFMSDDGERLTVAVVGTGRVGGALGPRFAELGFKVLYATRNPDRDTVRELVAQTGEDAQALPQAEAIAQADWVLLAIPWRAVEALLAEVGSSLPGKILIDVTNALTFGDDGMMAMAVDTSAGQIIQDTVPDAKVVKAFNTMGYHVMADPAAAGGPVTVPIVGNDKSAKTDVAAVIDALGFESADLGPIKHAHELEGMAVLYMVPYLAGEPGDRFEYYFRRGAGPAVSEGVRPAE